MHFKPLLRFPKQASVMRISPGVWHVIDSIYTADISGFCRDAVSTVARYILDHLLPQSDGKGKVESEDTEHMLRWKQCDDLFATCHDHLGSSECKAVRCKSACNYAKRDRYLA